MNDQLGIQNKLAYMDSLSRANGAGHKVDSELKEIVQSLRQDLGIADDKKIFDAAVKTEAETIARSLVLKYLKKMQELDILTYSQSEQAMAEMWNIKTSA